MFAALAQLFPDSLQFGWSGTSETLWSFIAFHLQLTLLFTSSWAWNVSFLSLSDRGDYVSFAQAFGAICLHKMLRISIDSCLAFYLHRMNWGTGILFDPQSCFQWDRFFSSQEMSAAAFTLARVVIVAFTLEDKHFQPPWSFSRARLCLHQPVFGLERSTGVQAITPPTTRSRRRTIRS